MINIHLNGDIVRCPDMREIQARAAEVRDLHRICKYNIHESSCQAWQIAVRTHKYCGRCCLAGCDSCPGHQIRTKLGKKEKQFKIDNQVYRKISSAAHYLVKESNNKVLFLTLTFPKFKKKVTYNETNKCFSKFVENLRTNYDCQGYIAVREFGEKSHRVHYHLLCSIPFIPFPVLNNAWCNAIKDISSYSKNALQTDPKTVFIKNPVRALRYVCKYFAKAKGQAHKSRLVFISNNIIQQPREFPRDINFRDVLINYGFTVTQTSDYTTLFRVNDPYEFNQFCKAFLYPFFELSDKKPGQLYAFPSG